MARVGHAGRAKGGCWRRKLVVVTVEVVTVEVRLGAAERWCGGREAKRASKIAKLVVQRSAARSHGSGQSPRDPDVRNCAVFREGVLQVRLIGPLIQVAHVQTSSHDVYLEVLVVERIGSQNFDSHSAGLAAEQCDT